MLQNIQVTSQLKSTDQSYTVSPRYQPTFRQKSLLYFSDTVQPIFSCFTLFKALPSPLLHHAIVFHLFFVSWDLLYIVSTYIASTAAAQGCRGAGIDPGPAIQLADALLFELLHTLIKLRLTLKVTPHRILWTSFRILKNYSALLALQMPTF